MGDLKLFRVSEHQTEELHGQSMTIEKSLQQLFERNLEQLLGIRFVASEYSTGRTHGGRIDTLGLDENNSPVIIEYKRSTNENVINQGLYYLDWLLDHQAEFELSILNQYGKEISNMIDWSNPRLVCIAGGFTKYDQHAVKQINRNIELYQYKYYDTGLLLLDLVNATTAKPVVGTAEIGNTSKTVSDYLKQATRESKDLFDSVVTYLMSLGDDVQENVTKHYIAYKRIKNFACVEFHPSTQKILMYVKVDPDTVVLEQGFTRDMRGIGHFGTGDLEIVIYTSDDFEKAKPHIQVSYEAN
ncbi:DUF5655 domain-containing protein [Exiguobacterium algae]|uniref:DUF5655 domain-containing protein n=1 Tax=Exiguobacterium algae TaxID=2751250 RepID=UPI001BEAF635|nr:DUF5655 domain-containing protein [Exiguobacterium algae]